MTRSDSSGAWFMNAWSALAIVQSGAPGMRELGMRCQI